jgi:hypothetical protein
VANVISGELIGQLHIQAIKEARKIRGPLLPNGDRQDEVVVNPEVIE